MNTKKAYVSPRVIRVNLEPTQAVLSHCNVDAHSLKNLQPTGFCDLSKDCKQAHSGDMDANS